MKHLNTEKIITIALSIGILIMIILIIRKISVFMQEKRKKLAQPSGSSGSIGSVVPIKPKEYYNTASELAGLDVYGGVGDFTDYRPDEGIFARDPIDINVRSDIMGGSGYETSGSSLFLDPSKFTIYAQKHDDSYGTY